MILRVEYVKKDKNDNMIRNVLADEATDLEDIEHPGIGSLAYCRQEDDGSKVYVFDGDSWEVL